MFLCEPDEYQTLHSVQLISVIKLISFPSPRHSFIPRLKPSFSANPFHRSLPFLLQDYDYMIPRTFTVTAEHIRFYFLVLLFYTL